MTLIKYYSAENTNFRMSSRGKLPYLNHPLARTLSISELRKSRLSKGQDEFTCIKSHSWPGKAVPEPPELISYLGLGRDHSGVNHPILSALVVRSFKP